MQWDVALCALTWGCRQPETPPELLLHVAMDVQSRRVGFNWPLALGICACGTEVAALPLRRATGACRCNPSIMIQTGIGNVRGYVVARPQWPVNKPSVGSKARVTPMTLRKTTVKECVSIDVRTAASAVAPTDSGCRIEAKTSTLVLCTATSTTILVIDHYAAVHSARLTAPGHSDAQQVRTHQPQHQ
jgi:hypothetical protein